MTSIPLPFRTIIAFTIFSIESLLMVTPGWTGEPEVYTNAASIMAFADNLFHRGHYYRAIMEYERLSYFYPQHPGIPKARFNILSHYPQHQLAEKARSTIEKIEKKLPQRTQR